MNAPLARRHDALSRVLHWVTAIVVTIAFVLGPEGFGRLMRQAVDPATLLGGVRVDPIPLVAGSRIASLADWGEVHGLLGDAILWLAGLYAAAAIYHRFVREDGVLSTMGFGRTSR